MEEQKEMEDRKIDSDASAWKLIRICSCIEALLCTQNIWRLQFYNDKNKHTVHNCNFF